MKCANKKRERREPDGNICTFNHITDIFHKPAKIVSACDTSFPRESTGFPTDLQS